MRVGQQWRGGWGRVRFHGGEEHLSQYSIFIEVVAQLPLVPQPLSPGWRHAPWILLHCRHSWCTDHNATTERRRFAAEAPGKPIALA